MFSRVENIAMRSIQVDLVGIGMSSRVTVVREVSSDQGQSEIGSDGRILSRKQMMVQDGVCQVFCLIAGQRVNLS